MSTRPSAERSTSDGSVRMQSYPYATTTDTEEALNSSTDSSAELQQVVDELLTQLQSKFTSVSSELLAKSRLPLHWNAMNHC